jgi:hypothetical protein
MSGFPFREFPEVSKNQNLPVLWRQHDDSAVNGSGGFGANSRLMRRFASRGEKIQIGDRLANGPPFFAAI